MDPNVDVDQIWYSLGRLGNYQKLQLFLIGFFTLENSFHMISIVYIGYRPPYKCADINVTSYLHNQQYHGTNDTDVDVRYGKCDIHITANTSAGVQTYKESCINGYSFDIPSDRSTVTEWNLVCSGAERSEFAQTLVMLGQAVGSIIFAPLSDKLGRKPCNVVARILNFLTALATVFTPSIDVFLVFRFLQGAFQGGSEMTNAVLYVELFPKELRHKIEAFMGCTWTCGLIFVSLVGYLCRDISWRYTQLVLALITVHALFDWLFLEESLRWLIANGKKDRAEKLLKKACRMNKVPYQQVLDSMTPSIEMKMKNESKSEENADLMQHETETSRENKMNFTKKQSAVISGDPTVTSGEQSIFRMTEDEDVNVKGSKVEKYSILTILKHRKILLTSIVIWVSWITNTLTYYGLMLTASKLPGDRFLNNVLSSLAEFPAIFSLILLVNRIGRKKTLTLFYAIAGVSLVLATVSTTFKSDYSWLSVLANIFSFIGRFASSGAFVTVFLFTSELYPTNLRNAGLGMASMISRIGSMMSPFAVTLAEHVSWGPAAVFAVLNLIVTISLLPLPETMGRELPTTLTEMKSWDKN